jgi:hypothetical protein
MASPAEIAALYKLPLAEFTAARNALAKQTTGDEAKQIRALAKPTVVPWTINQLYWHARPEWNRLLESGEQLREAQIAALRGQPADLREAATTHRERVAAAVRQAQDLASAAGVTPDSEPLARMLEALSLAPTLPDTPGQFTEVLKPAGFEALAGLGALIAPGKADTPHEAARPAARKAEAATVVPIASHRTRARSDEEREARNEDDAAARKRADADRRKAEAEAKREARAAEQAEKQRQAERHRLETRLARAREIAADAKAALERADADVQRLQHELKALS